MAADKPETPDPIEAARLELLARAENLERQARLAAEDAKSLREAAAKLDRGLTKRGDYTTLADVRSTSIARTTPENPVKGYNSGKATSNALRNRHPFIVALYEKEGLTMTAWAAKHKVPLSTVASWVSRGAAKRPITRLWADRIQKELGLPATEETWPNGIITGK